MRFTCIGTSITVGVHGQVPRATLDGDLAFDAGADVTNTIARGVDKLRGSKATRASERSTRLHLARVGPAGIDTAIVVSVDWA